jgi:hypothetical protein
MKLGLEGKWKVAYNVRRKTRKTDSEYEPSQMAPTPKASGGESQPARRELRLIERLPPPPGEQGATEESHNAAPPNDRQSRATAALKRVGESCSQQGASPRLISNHPPPPAGTSHEGKDGLRKHRRQGVMTMHKATSAPKQVWESCGQQGASPLLISSHPPPPASTSHRKVYRSAERDKTNKSDRARAPLDDKGSRNSAESERLLPAERTIKTRRVNRQAAKRNYRSRASRPVAVRNRRQPLVIPRSVH